MTGPYGQGQVINYLIGLTVLGYQFDILSFEDSEKFKKQGSYIKELLQKNNIGWYPQKMHSRPPIISKIFDKILLQKTANKLHKKNKYDLLHCRSYPAAEVALKLKKATGVHFLFDMRGFWADEKADGGSWDQKEWFWRKVYKFYKEKEKEFIKNADYIISLTNAGKNEIKKWSFYTGVPIVVIPCCADTNYFLGTTDSKKTLSREKLGISLNCFVLSYLGSLGTWYMIDEMLLFFSELKKNKPSAVFLIITNSDPKIITKKLSFFNLTFSDVKIITVLFTEVANYMYASDVNISFIKPVYSKMSSSPIKIGEVLSMGIPIIANNIGDSGIFINEHKVGAMLNDVNLQEIRNCIQKIDNISLIDPDYIRNIAIQEYDIKKGVNLYANTYKNIFC